MESTPPEASDLATTFIRECARNRAMSALAQIRNQEAAETARLLLALGLLQQRLSGPLGRPCRTPERAIHDQPGPTLDR
jgi:hypothetical protein